MKKHLTTVAISSLLLMAFSTFALCNDRTGDSPSQNIIFLDVETAKKAITTDEVEGFFDKVQLLDIKIQMKNNSTESAEIIRASYLEYLQASVEAFTPEEEKAVRASMNRAKTMCNNIATDIFPVEIRLIKTNMNHYGASVFYSRENCIIIPKNVLSRTLDTEFLQAVLREIFHIYSRYNYWKRITLYRQIGFEPIYPLSVPTVLSQKQLTSPNGIDNFVIHHLSDANQNDFSAIPIISAKAKSNLYRSLSFYSNLEFALYKVENNKVITNDDGSSTVDMTTLQGFYEQIGTNTNYIIHPDEILADNFAILAFWQSNHLTIAEMGIDSDGKILLLEMEKNLKKKQE